jgi:two-component system, sensor histidine kinase and response regulator
MKMTKILVIEDEPILLKEVMRWLTLEDYEVIGAADGVEGVRLAFEQLPHVILCDIALPHRDGYGVMFDIRANTQTQLTPFIFMTARTSHEDIRKGITLGADDYLTKPFTRLELLDAVQAILDKRNLQEERHQSELEQWQQAFQHEHEQRLFKAKIVAMFSHDFRNPLATMMISNSVLRKHGHRMESEQQEVHYDRIERSIRNLQQMLNDMLIVAQLETGNLEFEPQPLNITEYIQEIVDDFQFVYSETHTLVYKSDFTDTITADERLLRQIAANLISNAIKYSPRGSQVEISLGQIDECLMLTVRDYGIGIPEAEQKNMFKAFHRASNAGNASGTGLGLAIVQQAVNLHEGTIELNSQLGVGTSITVKIPL